MNECDLAVATVRSYTAAEMEALTGFPFPSAVAKASFQFERDSLIAKIRTVDPAAADYVDARKHLIGDPA